LASSDGPEQRFLATCLKYLRGDDAARQQLLSCIARDRSHQGLLALDSLELRNDPAAIEMLVTRPQEDDVDDFLFTAWADKYLMRVATPAHLKTIKQRAARQSLYERDDTEDIIRAVRFHELLRRSLPANTLREPGRKTEVPRNDGKE